MHFQCVKKDIKNLKKSFEMYVLMFLRVFQHELIKYGCNALHVFDWLIQSTLIMSELD